MTSARVTSREKKAVLRTVDRYANGLRGQIRTLKQAFRPRAIVYGYVGKMSYFDHVKQLSDWVRKNATPANGIDHFRYKVRGVIVSGQTATVQLSETAYVGADYETNLQLMKIRGKWLIVSKLFSGKPRPKSR